MERSESYEEMGSVAIESEEVVELASGLSEGSTTVFWPSCKCAGACKTSRCPCYKHNCACNPERCKCRVSRCSRQIEKASVDIADLGGEIHSSDEDEQYCVCEDNCQVTSCYCLAIKQKSCDPSMCKCKESLCKNITVFEEREDNVEDEVKTFCKSHTKDDVEKVLFDIATRCPHLWISVIHKGPNDSQPSSAAPKWCKCGKCREELPEDRICCNNEQKNHEHAVFEQLCLDEHTLEVAIINNCDWLNMPRVFTPSKFRNTAYRQYILWYYGKLGYRNRRRIPSCIKWKIRERYPEPNGQYMGFMEAL